MVKPVLDVVLPILVVLMTALVGLQLTAADFGRICRQPLVVCVATMAQAILLPLLGVVLVSVVVSKPHVASGLVLVVACPIGSLANYYSCLAKANVALSVTLTALSCLATVVTTPLAMAVFQSQFGEPAFDAPLSLIARQMLGMLVVPVLGGMAIRRGWPQLVNRYSRFLLGVGIAALAALLGLVIYQERARFIADLPDIVPAAFVLTTGAMLMGYGTGYVLRVDDVDRRTLAFVFAVRNVGLATTIALTALGRLEFAVFAAGYFLSQTPVLLTSALVLRSWRRQVAA